MNKRNIKDMEEYIFNRNCKFLSRDYDGNNTKLLEIPYWDYKNIESILSKELNLNFSEHNLCAERKEN